MPVDKDISSIEGTQLLDSLDIRLQLSGSIFIGSPEKIEMKLINNSGYTVLTGNPYLLKRFEFGYWSVVPEFEKMIWTDEGYDIEPESERIFILHIDFLNVNLGKGKYQIEKEVSVLITREKTQTDNDSTENRLLKTEFIIK